MKKKFLGFNSPLASWRCAILFALLALSKPAFALSIIEGTSLSCLDSSLQPCSTEQLYNPTTYRQIYIFPTGFAANEKELFEQEFALLVQRMTQVPSSLYSNKYQRKIIYLGLWMPSAPLESGFGLYGAKVLAHPIRGTALTVNQNLVTFEVDLLKRISPFPVAPFAVGVFFNWLEDTTANAAPPNFLGQKYGIAKFTRYDLDTPYVVTHEFAHASLNFLDEYVEQGFESMSINTLDLLSPLALLDGTFGGAKRAIQDLLGIYDIKLSEVLAGNGNDNMDTSKNTSRVSTDWYTPNPYEYEGGMFFGKGTYHDRGNNLMNSDTLVRGTDDKFAYAHSASQARLVDYAFEQNVTSKRSRYARPNDRIRNAGPLTWFPSQWGSQATLMMFDGDKNHHFHATRSYQIQVGWYDRDWKVCRKWGFPYPCYDEIWKVAEKTVLPKVSNLSLPGSALFGLAKFLNNLACDIGIKQINRGDQTFKLCEQSLDRAAAAFLPTFVFKTPYERVSVPTSQWLTKYYWHFRTDNGEGLSGWTSWASFRRYL